MPITIAVYAPARNEADNVAAWAASAAEADEIVLVDTGSTDSTLDEAARAGVEVRQAVVSPWRFDDGFNVALSQVAGWIDIAVPLHLDERLHPGWREELAEGWARGGRQFTFLYHWGDGVSYRHDRIHARHGYRWIYPAHECLVGPGPKVDTGVVISQPGGPGSARRNDSSLIHLMLEEHPDDPRALYYSAREHYYCGEWSQAREKFTRYLERATYAQERSEACRAMAQMVWEDQQESWLLRAVAECPARREVWADLARWYHDRGMTAQAAGVAARLLTITTQDATNSYRLEASAWDDAAFLAIRERG